MYFNQYSNIGNKKFHHLYQMIWYVFYYFSSDPSNTSTIHCKVYFIVEFSFFLRVKRIEFKPSKFFCQDFSLCQKGPSYAF